VESFVDLAWEPDEVVAEADVEGLASRCEAMVAALGQRPVSLLLCDDGQIHDLNRQWRDEDKPTDVLSFAFDEADAPPIVMDDEAAAELPLGDVVISVPTAARQAATHGWALDDELTFLFAHGLCHLMGHDHAEPEEAAAMASEETRLLAIFGLQRPSGLGF